MHSVKFKQLGVILLSVLWLMGSANLLEKSISTDSASYAEVTTPTKSVTADIKPDHILYFYKEHLNWLSLFIEVDFDKSDHRIPPWPALSQLSTFFNIITYQYYLSLLSQVSFFK